MGCIFVILTAYCDESGTHGGDGTAANPASPMTVMAGAMATANQWRLFERDFAEIRKRYGFDILHTVDFKRRQREFAGWSIPKMLGFLQEFQSVIGPKRLMENVSFRLDNEAFKSEYHGTEKIRKPRLDTAYGFSLRNCVLHFLLEAERHLGTHKKWPETKLNFVLELGHKHKGDAARIFDEMKKELEREGNHTLGMLTFAAKHEAPPLMIGDFISHATWWMEQVRRSQNLPAEPFFGDKICGESNLTHITYVPGGLSNVKNQLLDRVRSRQRSTSTPVASSTPGRGPLS